MKVYRRSETVAHLLDELEKQELLLDDQRVHLDHCFSNLQLDLFSTNHQSQYSDEVKKFACTLNLYSPKAYDYVKKILNLPCKRTLRRWMEGINGNPGLSKQMFDVIKQKAKNDEQAFRYCTVMVDSMAIKKHVEWDHNKQQMIGLVDYGPGTVDSDSVPVASEALVVMAVGVLGHWKMPLAYFLVDKVTGVMLSCLLKEILLNLLECGVTIVGIICDGCSCNQQMLRNLGANLNPDILNNFIAIESEESNIKIPIFLDTCHMLKLVRNCFADYKILKSKTGYIEWNYISALEALQASENLTLANKLTKEHIDFHRNKMKVKFAVQVLSSSVAAALKFCQKAGYSQFRKCDATIEFLEIINRLFDILNSRNPFAKGYKAPISNRNWTSTEAFLLKARDYLMSLQTADGKPLHVGRRRTAFIGLTLNIQSTIWFVEMHVLNTDSPFKYMLTYKWSQDHLELFFGSIRQVGRFNNNPTTKEFCSIYKKMLFHCGVTPSENGSVIPLDATDMIDISHARTKDTESKCTGELALKIFESKEHDHLYFSIDCMKFSPLVDNVLAYIAGFVAKKCLLQADCDVCREALVERNSNYLLIMIKDNGGLTHPSKDLVRTVKIIEKVIRCTCHVRDITKKTFNWGLKLETEVLRTLAAERNLFATINCDKYNFLKCIIQNFLKVRCHFVAKSFNLTLRETHIRQSLTRSIIFKNQ